jgi:Flp pilus assembly protein TadG
MEQAVAGRDGTSGRTWPRRLVGDRRAMVLVELALIGPVFLLGVIVLFQFSYLYLAQQFLEAATEVSARSIMTGNAQMQSSCTSASITAGTCTSPVASSSDFVTNVLCPALLYLQCGNLLVNAQAVPAGDDYFASVLAMPTFISGGSVSTSGLKFCNGQAGQFMKLNVVYMAPIWVFGSLPFIGPLWPGAVTYNGSTTIPLYAASAFTDEQFSLSSSLTTTGSNACS